jgi:CheY-like chemotaxis protein
VPQEKARILLVCDSREDIRATRAMLLSNGITSEVVVAHDGDQALGLLQPDVSQQALDPALLLLDLRTPRMNGFDFLIHVRADPATRDLPVVVLPTVTEQTPTRELLSGEEYADDSSVPKPRTAKELITALRTLGASWLEAGKHFGVPRATAAWAS